MDILDRINRVLTEAKDEIRTNMAKAMNLRHDGYGRWSNKDTRRGYQSYYWDSATKSFKTFETEANELPHVRRNKIREVLMKVKPGDKVLYKSGYADSWVTKIVKDIKIYKPRKNAWSQDNTGYIEVGNEDQTSSFIKFDLNGDEKKTGYSSYRDTIRPYDENVMINQNIDKELKKAQKELKDKMSKLSFNNFRKEDIDALNDILDELLPDPYEKEVQ